MTKKGLTCAIFVVNWILRGGGGGAGKFIRKYCLLFFTDIKILMFHNNIVKIQKF